MVLKRVNTIHDIIVNEDRVFRIDIHYTFTYLQFNFISPFKRVSGGSRSNPRIISHT